jgi:prophage antirepressor-like protein
MGIELDVLVGHPEHDLLFIVAQVARVSGLKNVYNLTSSYKRLKINLDRKWFDLGSACGALPLLQGQPTDEHGRGLPANTTLFTEGDVYAMLLRSNAPQTEPFRKWVTEEVLPTIRKTGKYNAEESTNPAVLRT